MPVFMNREGKFSIRQNPEPLWNEVKLPEEVGVIWHDDQEFNQIVVEHSYETIFWADYEFNPEDDLALIADYVDQLLDIYEGEFNAS